MRIREVRAQRHRIPLTHSYTVAYGTKELCDCFTVEIEAEDGTIGYGAGTPSKAVTGVDADETEPHLSPEALEPWRGRDPRELGNRRADVVGQFEAFPAAAAAMDIACHDLFARWAGVPLVDLLGRCHTSLPTSATIGIGSIEHTLEEAERHVGRGFRTLKVKIGHDLDLDLERLARLREVYGAGVALRVDANQGYSPGQTRRFLREAVRHDLEFVEQPMKPELDGRVDELDGESRGRLVMDESVQRISDLRRLMAFDPPLGGINIKLMKSGGVGPSQRIAQLADAGGLSVMWGCMDESVISIAAALHLAYACPNTRWLDLDGSLDLSTDVAVGGFEVRDGHLVLTGAPGLGVRAADAPATGAGG